MLTVINRVNYVNYFCALKVQKNLIDPFEVNESGVL